MTRIKYKGAVYERVDALSVKDESVALGHFVYREVNKARASIRNAYFTIKESSLKDTKSAKYAIDELEKLESQMGKTRDDVAGVVQHLLKDY